MAERILKFGGIDPLSRSESRKGEAEPDTDPRGRQGTEIIGGMHMMSAVEQLQPVSKTRMAYFDPDAPDMSLGELEDAVAEGGVSLEEVMTKTDRFTPLVNPRRSREKDHGERDPSSEGDLWHVPTSNYQARTPRQMFEPLARSVGENGSVEDSSVYGEFRERRNGGEVHGHVWFDDFDVGAIEGDPVRLGLRFRWNYYGDLSFSYRPFAQQTRCKNSVRALDDWEPVMAHNRDPNLREKWDEAVRALGLYGDALSQQIQAARDVLFGFGGVEPDASDGPDVIPMPMTLEAFYEHCGFPDARVMAEHARDEARASGDPRESAQRINAWHVHAGATYWLAWHWNGAESSRAFREYRRAADDLLMNPNQMVDRARESYEEEVRGEIVSEVLDEGQDLSDASAEQRDEIELRMMEHEGVATMGSSAETMETMVERFEETEQRLDAIEAAMAEEA